MTGLPPRVVAVVVAWNRRELVVETLAALAAQTVPLHDVVVIDNASTDGSADVIRARFPEVALTTLPTNTGGAGGFTAGIERALSAHDAELVWLMDDDTVPDPPALEELLRARAVAPRGTVVLASAVRWTDGRPHPMNTPRTRPSATRASVERAARHGCTPVRTASFVSMMIEVDAIRAHGLPMADYFLWNDDFEYSARLLRRGRGYLVHGSTVEHRTRTFGSTDVDPGARFVFEVRNKIWMLRLSRALAPAERVLYAGAALRGWARTIARSADRPLLIRGLVDGIRQGLGRRPRPAAEVLAGLGGITEGVRRIEAGAGRS
ncbi:N-glycosyltransferase [Clavibacter michiganensis subsp. michiganensis]|uniref:glycosyltransferase n=1 Tax=Clavibacter michiganensis TaxID=28447 RepID=UPI0013036B20|nr:glycosyltransferase [Clavibacter michiganensis]KAF0260025.1 N-glycosyltransferase [Clavibacter michiganensis subsp. michiganensis]